MRDIFTFPLLKDATISLMDVNAERLEFTRQSVQCIVDMGGYPATVEPTRYYAPFWPAALVGRFRSPDGQCDWPVTLMD